MENRSKDWYFSLQGRGGAGRLVKEFKAHGLSARVARLHNSNIWTVLVSNPGNVDSEEFDRFCNRVAFNVFNKK